DLRRELITTSQLAGVGPDAEPQTFQGAAEDGDGGIVLGRMRDKDVLAHGESALRVEGTGHAHPNRRRQGLPSSASACGDNVCRGRNENLEPATAAGCPMRLCDRIPI